MKQSQQVFERLQINQPLNRSQVSLRDDQLLMEDAGIRGNPSQTYPVPLQWLRDHCHCNKCVHPSTKQRLVETFQDIPADISTKSISEDDSGFSVTWSDGHSSYYTKQWLTEPRASTIKFIQRQGWVDPVFWTGASIQSHPPTVDYNDVMKSDEGLRDWLEKIKKYGFCYVENTPVTPEDTKKLLERIAYIRNTHYGAFWDFTADLSKGDTAYTQLGIGPHTDNTYFSDPAGLQLFHLLSHTNGEGGVSGLVDGFAAARELRLRDENAYKQLSTTAVYCHASGNEDSSIQPYISFPVLVHDPRTQGLVQVRWNTTDRARVDIALNLMDLWYDAARKWSDILKEFEYWEQLKPGKALSKRISSTDIYIHLLNMPLVFDNWRVLHARSAFTGKRRMCGGYSESRRTSLESKLSTLTSDIVNRDDFISRFKMLQNGRDKVLEHVSAA
jgi:trimethyllysine dioxygenase